MSLLKNQKTEKVIREMGILEKLNLFFLLLAEINLDSVPISVFLLLIALI